MVTAKIEKNTLFGRALVRIRVILDKTLFLGRALVRIRAKYRKKVLVVFWLE